MWRKRYHTDPEEQNWLPAPPHAHLNVTCFLTSNTKMLLFLSSVFHSILYMCNSSMLLYIV